MRRSFLTYTAVGTSSLLAVWPASVHAANFDWAGPYFGGSIGGVFPSNTPALNYPQGGFQTNNVYFDDNTPIFSDVANSGPPIAWPTEGRLDASDFIGTANVGYNFRHGNVVFGIELDASFFGNSVHSGSSWTTGTINDPDNERVHSITVTGGLDNLFSIRPRLGVAVDRFLLYGTGGLAFGHASLSTSAYLDQGKGSADWNGSNSDWKLGFIVGVGAEYAVTDNLSVKLEAMYYDLGSISTEAQGEGSYFFTPLDVSPYEASLGLSGAIVRGGVNLRY